MEFPFYRTKILEFKSNFISMETNISKIYFILHFFHHSLYIKLFLYFINKIESKQEYSIITNFKKNDKYSKYKAKKKKIPK